jgi:hypothetical protein
MDCRKQITRLGRFNRVYKWKTNRSDHEHGGRGHSYSQKHCCYTSDKILLIYLLTYASSVCPGIITLGMARLSRSRELSMIYYLQMTK